MPLTTRWGATLAGSPEPLPDYPRPMLARRDWRNLNGTWLYAVRPKGAVRPRDEVIPSGFDGEITVPFAIETEASGVHRGFTPDEALFYQRDVEVPWEGRTVLNFEAVDYRCAVFVDGVLAGEHRGGYLPFAVELPPGVGPRRIIVVVHDPSDSGNQQHGKQALEPGGIWYTATSGIWGSVWMEPLPGNAITGVVATAVASLDGLTVRVETERPDDVTVAVGLPDGGVATASGPSGLPLHVALPQARAWSPRDPHLYPLTVTSSQDEVASWAGVRTVELGPIPGAPLERPAVLLNGEPILLNTPLDQGYWPESGLTPPADEALVFDLETLRDMGFNGARMHIKVASRRYYHHADRLGMLVVQDMVSGGVPRTDLRASAAVQLSDAHLSDRSRRAMRAAGRGDEGNRREYLSELEAMVRLLQPHPSIVAWVPFNESWGQFDALGAAALVRRVDPTRLVDHASGWFDQGGGDFRSRHRYTLALRRPPRRDHRPFWLSEFGGYNLAVPGHLWDADRRFGYKFFDGPHALAAGIAALWRDQLIPLVGHGLRAAVYTQVSDVEIENNGLLTYDREVLKVPADLMRDLNRELYEAFSGLAR